MVLRRVLSYVIGLFILSFGITLTIVAGLGVGAWDALNVGLSETVGLTVGNWVIIVGVILIILNAILLKSRPEVAALITVVLLGYFIDFWLLVVFPGVSFQTFIVQLLILFIGAVLMAIGIATYLQAGFAAIPIDRLMFVIQHLTKFKLMTSKTIAEVLALACAFLVGGPIGIGTVVVTFLIGPLIQLVFPTIEKIIKGQQSAA
ncbi:YczE/YyaS/YitT family protein [Desertibacillus haloalkaliphilus]|uniref:YczE/YyaS/YitT family protein n=1 Tax=Desertibacillus haloalkaliphilus TaxID=1328930 RepID=UPI001C2689AB|nr:membrane protein [Desertibacillus haloalkaliphilus]MBU8908896.1 membrane protein [Desertibacillus haloalkaliphilus]